MGCYNREFARPMRALAKDYGLEALITDDYLEVEAAIEALAPELILGTQMERHIAKRLGIPCAVISAPVHVQDFPARYSPQMGFEGANVIFDTWVHPLVMGLEEHLLHMFREDFEFHDAAGASHHGGHKPAAAPRRSRRCLRRGCAQVRPRLKPPAGARDRSGCRRRERAEEDPVLRARQGPPQHREIRRGTRRHPDRRSTRCMRQRPIMRDEHHVAGATYRVVIVTLDAHAAGPAARIAAELDRDFPRHQRLGPCRRRMGRKPRRP